jgi:hypothetical protein
MDTVCVCRKRGASVGCEGVTHFFLFIVVGLENKKHKTTEIQMLFTVA